MKTIFKQEYVSPCSAVGRSTEPGSCPRCGRELRLAGDPKRNCSRTCYKALQALSLAEREARRSATPFGSCVGCGAEVEPPVYLCPTIPRAWIKRWRRAAGGQLRFGPDAFEWLAEKLHVDPADERLPDVALELARAGRLTVLLRDGQVAGIAKAKERATA